MLQWEFLLLNTYKLSQDVAFGIRLHNSSVVTMRLVLCPVLLGSSRSLFLHYPMATKGLGY